MKYLKKFENHAAYKDAESGLILPNVSICVNENDVHYNPYVDPYAGHDYVDLGLPSGTKWATMNVGASSETDYGNYYQYGKGSRTYEETSGETYYQGTENPLALSADTATQVWGGSWHMPTSAQCQELVSECTWTWTTSGGTNGYKVAKGNKSIFLPAAGRWYGGSQYDVGSNGLYWSASPINSDYAYNSYFGSLHESVSVDSRSCGFSVRPVAS